MYTYYLYHKWLRFVQTIVFITIYKYIHICILYIFIYIGTVSSILAAVYSHTYTSLDNVLLENNSIIIFILCVFQDYRYQNNYHNIKLNFFYSSIYCSRFSWEILSDDWWSSCDPLKSIRTFFSKIFIKFQNGSMECK